MQKTVAFVLLAASLLAGCGVAPTASSLNATGMRPSTVRSLDAEKSRVELRVPARVLGYVDEYVEGLKREYAQEKVQDMYGRPMYPKYTVKFDGATSKDVKVMVSADDFKTTLAENTYNAGRRQDGRDLLVPFLAPAGSVKYYLEVSASLYLTSTDKLVKHLPAHYISNEGANYDGRLEAARS